MKDYLDMTDEELIKEIHYVENILKTNNNYFAKKQNSKYLKKLHYEWGLRKNGR